MGKLKIIIVECDDDQGEWTTTLLDALRGMIASNGGDIGTLVRPDEEPDPASPAQPDPEPDPRKSPEPKRRARRRVVDAQPVELPPAEFEPEAPDDDASGAKSADERPPPICDERDPLPTAESTLAHQVLVAYTKDPNYPQADLARELYGVSNGETLRKTKRIVESLVCTKRLRRVGAASYEPSMTFDRRSFTKQIVEAFSKDKDYPLEQLTVELYGDDTPESRQKLRVNLCQLVARKKLERLGLNSFRPRIKL